MTKISPIIRIAAPTPWRTKGSPVRAISRFSALACSLSLVSARPMTRPQVAVLTRVELALPLCARQSPSPSLSAIRLSAVSGSGTRRNASARLSSATPSCVFSRYSWRNWLTQPLRLRLAQLGEHGERPRLDPAARIGVERGALQQRRQHFGLGRAEQLADVGARRCRSVSHVAFLLRLESRVAVPLDRIHAHRQHRRDQEPGRFRGRRLRLDR